MHNGNELEIMQIDTIFMDQTAFATANRPSPVLTFAKSSF